MFAAANVAVRLTIGHFGHNRDGTRANAVQHCIWNAAMRFWYGYNAAKGFADRHESCQPFGWLKIMDYVNNEIGRQLGRSVGWFDPYGDAKRLCLKAGLFVLR